MCLAEEFTFSRLWAVSRMATLNSLWRSHAFPQPSFELVQKSHSTLQPHRHQSCHAFPLAKLQAAPLNDENLVTMQHVGVLNLAQERRSQKSGVPLMR